MTGRPLIPSRPNVIGTDTGSFVDPGSPHWISHESHRDDGRTSVTTWIPGPRHTKLTYCSGYTDVILTRF